MDPCNDAQEKIARGEALAPAERGHAAACPRCLSVAAVYGELDAALDAASVPVLVPSGFADRVMAGLPALDADADADAGELGVAARLRWFERRWVEIVFAHAAALVTALNVARFIARIFVSQIAQGGSP